MKPHPFERWFKETRSWYRFHSDNDPSGERLRFYESGAKDAWIHLRNIHGRELKPYHNLVDVAMRILQENEPINTPFWYELKKALSEFYPEIDMIMKIKNK